jgi:hypothetical protein
MLYEQCADDDHAGRMINAAIQRKFGLQDKTEDRCAGPFDLAILCTGFVPERAELVTARPDCGGMGWKIVERGGVTRATCCYGTSSGNSFRPATRAEKNPRPPVLRRHLPAHISPSFRGVMARDFSG